MATDEGRSFISHNRSETPYMAGFFAAVIMTLLAHFLGWLGFQVPSFETLYGSIWNDRVPPESFSRLWWLGLVTHLVLATYVYSTVSEYVLEFLGRVRSYWVRGIALGSVFWLFQEMILRPIAGEGFFSSQLPQAASLVILSFVLWSIYGVLYERLNRDGEGEGLLVRDEHGQAA